MYKRQDETQTLKYKQQVNDQKLVAGLIYLDNYEEALESVEEVRRSLLTALIDRKISKYIACLLYTSRKAVKEVNPEVLILAEHYGDPASWLQGDQWLSLIHILKALSQKEKSGNQRSQGQAPPP